MLQPTTIEADFLLLNPIHRGGDVIAQCGESYHNNLERVKEGKEEIELAVNWKRAGRLEKALAHSTADRSYHC